ncbi:DUF3854 domain-containing protein [Komarekiella sp. 'clone 1']|uniref:DUF3854 domain-containing protein n=1 Tax=Komarekiella delphini-convector SJRDD-AB1 TaxID=2593771 RepID=A0AA40T3X8_9NOST|nr:DUF3854 domain-containing protein [Komarekiella delphini-convector]MBD6620481.1 DUF3854 domain-containing protein [Komarekiella delphini-convector SJRDD-AB1]
MFDERLNSLNPTIFDREDYQRTLKILNALIPVIEASVERLQYEWDKLAHVEIGDDTYVLKPNESGGYSWEKIDYEDHDWYEEEDEPEVEIDEENLVNSDVSTTAQPSAASEQSTNVTAQEPQEETVTNATVSEVLTNAQSSSEQIPITTVQQQPEETPTNLQQQFEQSAQQSKTNTPQASKHIDPKHWQELVDKSAIAPEIAKRNFTSLHHDPIEQSHESWEYLMYSNKLERKNAGQLTDKTLKIYSFLDTTDGWWCNGGVDPRSFAGLSAGQTPPNKLWGCYKPDSPRPDRKKIGKFTKYEHPYKDELSIFLLEVPDEIANKVYSKAGVNPSASDRQSGFWYCVWKHNIPITITEGAKKTAAILSQGDAAIGLPGINAGYRSYDQQKNPITPHLREEFAVFATPGRDIKICFDYETKAKTKRSVFAALAQTGKLLEAAEVKVSVVSLPGPEKGIDDLIVAHGAETYQKVMSEVLPLQQWQQQNPPPDLRFIITLKDGREINLYEKLSDGTVTSNPAELNSAEIDTLTQKLQENLPLSKGFVESQIVAADLEASNDKNDHTQVNFPKYWAGQRQVPNYAQNLPRSFLLQKENKQIALTAKKLVDQYGGKEDDGSLVYRSEAFSIRIFRDKISIHRAVDEKESYFSFPLMQFEVDKKDKVKIIKPPLKMLSVERQEFLNVANSNELPSFYEDAITLNRNLGSLAPLGTQKVIKNLEVLEVSQLLTTILETAGSKHLQVGEYRIKSEVNQQTGHSSIKLIKKDNQGLERVAVQIDRNTNETQIMKVNEEDMNNLRLIAKRVQLEYSDSVQQQFSSYTSPESTNKYNTNSSVNNDFASTSKPKSQAKEKEHNQNRGYMGRTIKELMSQYGTTQNDGSRIYHSQAYTFVTNNTSLMVYRRSTNSLKKSKDLIVKIDNYQNETMSGKIRVWEISPSEKSIFIEMANSLNSGKKLPPINSSATELNAALGCLSPLQSSPKRQSSNQRKSRDIEL